MNKKEKLVKRFRSLPKDFSFEEVVSLFKCCGFTLENKGATSGSRVRFYNKEDQNAYIMHYYQRIYDEGYFGFSSKEQLYR